MNGGVLVLRGADVRSSFRQTQTVCESVAGAALLMYSVALGLTLAATW